MSEFNLDTITGIGNMLGNGTSKPGWSDISGAITATAGAINTLKPTPITGGLTTNPIINSNFEIKLPTYEDITVDPKGTEVGLTVNTGTEVKKDKTLLYVGIGVGIVVLGLVIYFMIKRK